jgi:predicted PurR-regulated permease PerM
METRLSPRSKLIAFWALAGLVLVGLAHFFSVLSPFLWAIITAYIATPLITLLARRTRLPRPLIATVVYLAIVAALIFGIITLVPVVQRQGSALINQLPQTTEAGIDYLYEHFPALTQQLGLDREILQRGINDATGQITSRVPLTALTIAQELFHFVLEFFVYLIATFFFFLQGDRFVAGLRRSVPLRYQREADRVFGEINATMGAYLRGQVLLIAIMSTVTYIALSIYDMPYAIALALATGCLELIPILGPWSAGAIAVAVAALDPTPAFGWSNATLAIVVAITYLALRQLEDILVIPTLIGRIVHLHPLLVIFVLLIGTSVGGILGLLLAVPTAAVLRILLHYVYGKIVAEGSAGSSRSTDTSICNGCATKCPA